MLFHKNMSLFKNKIPESVLLSAYANIFNEAPTILAGQIDIIEKDLNLIQSNCFNDIIFNKIQIITNDNPYFCHTLYRKETDKNKEKINSFFYYHYSNIFKKEAINPNIPRELLLKLMNAVFMLSNNKKDFIIDKQIFLGIIEQHSEKLNCRLKENQQLYNYNVFIDSIFNNSFLEREDKLKIYNWLNIHEYDFYKRTELIQKTLLDFKANNIQQMKDTLYSPYFLEHYEPNTFFKDSIMKTDNFNCVTILRSIMQLYIEDYDKANVIVEFFLENLKARISKSSESNSLKGLDYLIYHIQKKKDIRIIEAMPKFLPIIARYEREKLERDISHKDLTQNKFKI